MYQKTKQVLQTLFRAYDIRGQVEDELTPNVVYSIGLAFGAELQARAENSVVVGRDGRLSGPTLIAALIAGLRDSGIDVIDAGMLPTPVLYFALEYWNIPNGMMLTGSHNPVNYNGLKMVVQGHTISAAEIQELYQRILAGNFIAGQGQLETKTIIDDYIAYIVKHIQLARPLKIVVDAGNGVAGLLAPTLFRALGCEVTPLFCEVDGHFPNHHPDPGDPENLHDLIQAVQTAQADLGLAFDGDGDRLGVVTSTGEVIFSDRQLILFAQDVLSRNPGAEIIYDVKCSRHVARSVQQFGGKPTMWKTGHSFIKAKLKETGALLAGEMSGHIFFKERWFGFDDGLYAGARLLEILAKRNDDAATVFAELPQDLATPELSIAMPDDKKFKFVERLIIEDFPQAKKVTLDGLRVEYADGWGLLRCSNTTPKLVLRFEADNQSALERIMSVFREKLYKLEKNLVLNF